VGGNLVLTVNKNSVEYLPVLVADRLGGITTLDGYDIQFRITDQSETQVQNWTDCDNDGMTVLPLIDATQSGLEDGGTYKLYIKITITPEIPILGPIEFEVS
jgi:hypothetical protein